ncbi:MAG: hypothetical protein V1769_02600 [Thermoplasmatota archaeon]
MKKILVIFLIFNVASIGTMTSTITAFHSEGTSDERLLVDSKDSVFFSEHVPNTCISKQKDQMEIVCFGQLNNDLIIRMNGLERSTNVLLLLSDLKKLEESRSP